MSKRPVAGAFLLLAFLVPGLLLGALALPLPVAAGALRQERPTVEQPRPTVPPLDKDEDEDEDEDDEGDDEGDDDGVDEIVEGDRVEGQLGEDDEDDESEDETGADGGEVGEDDENEGAQTDEGDQADENDQVLVPSTLPTTGDGCVRTQYPYFSYRQLDVHRVRSSGLCTQQHGLKSRRPRYQPLPPLRQ